MNTEMARINRQVDLGSDSSMVDEYVSVVVVSLGYSSGSDSSMVDEYAFGEETNRQEITFRFLYGRWIPLLALADSLYSQVQIPLWSMNTSGSGSDSTRYPACSDSSMVDEYRCLSAHWGWMLAGSDSSMVDEYFSC